ncbi:GIY-YIG nuclease family protein [Arhodomonas sp. AD133]|uniref:GIY-YIG nuclease family protein n=1 Tax=Arhodomonas sp. AD133 TaxID=3415009 RepID=UPI003EB69935
MLCQDGDGPGYVKFGYSGRIGDRLSALRSSCPIPARFFAISCVGNTKRTALEVESALHSRFSDRRSSGEWFRFDFSSPEDKRDFNEGSLGAFVSVLGGDYEWWVKLSVKALDEYERRRRAALLKGGSKKRLDKKRRQQQAERRAQRELDEWRWSA